MKNIYIYIMSYKNIRIQGYLRRRKHNIQRYVHQDHGCQAIPSTLNHWVLLSQLPRAYLLKPTVPISFWNDNDPHFDIIVIFAAHFWVT
jgi:hypothetical protein